MGRRADAGIFFLITLFAMTKPLSGEDIRVIIAGSSVITLKSPAPAPLSLAYNDSALIYLEGDTRFFRGLELELKAPPEYLPYQGSLALSLYSDLTGNLEKGIRDIKAKQLMLQSLPNKIQSVYQIPLQGKSGLKNSPYATVLDKPQSPSSFPLLLRLMPVIKGLHESIESMSFTLTVKPLISDQGAVRIIPRFPEHLRDKPYTVLIDDAVVEKSGEEQILQEGEHTLVILSQDYRNENRVFLVERAKVLELTVQLEDLTPIVIFEAPENARIYFDNSPLESGKTSIPTEPGVHEVKFQLSDYAVVRTLSIQKGKTYKVSLSVDINVTETE